MISEKLNGMPYVNSQHLSQKVGKSVRLVCRIDSISPDCMKVKVEAADKGTVIVNRVPGASPYQTAYVVITGLVKEDLSIAEQSSEPFGNTFDMENFNRVIGHMSKLPSIFVQ